MLFSGHLDHLEAEGYDVDDTARSQALMPQQEMLMKMFAVRIILFSFVRLLEGVNGSTLHITLVLMP